MNKTEKLLAARKRLKEFQLSKKSNAVSNAPQDTNENAAESGPSSLINDNVTAHNSNVDPHLQRSESLGENNHNEIINNCQTSEPIISTIESIDSTGLNANYDSTEDETKFTNLSSADRFFKDTVDFSKNQIFDEFSGIVSNFTNNEEEEKTKNVLTNDQSTENLINAEKSFTDNNETDKLNDVCQIQKESVSNDKEMQLENLETEVLHGSQSGSNNDYSMLFGSQVLQKEYLMQMTSAVTNALDNDSEGKDITQEINSDLEQRNQFLATCLQEQREIVNRLHVEVSQYKTRISELETIIATKDAESEARLYRELNPLKEQLQLHAQTTGILVGEKAELTAALLQSQTTAKQKVAEVEELNGKLKSLQIQLYELERELNSVKNNSEDAGKVNLQLQSNYISLENKYSLIRQEKDDLELETAELRQKLNVKNTELTNIEQELKEKTALLSLNELRMQQMNSSSQETQAIGEQHHVVAALEQQLSQLMETLKAVSSERDEASSHYQNYVQQLNAQVTTLAQKLEQTTKENAEISSREHSLIQRLSDLECQIQSQRDIPEPPAPIINDNKEEINQLEKNVDQLTMERDNLRVTLYEKESDINALKRELEELQEMRSSNDEASRLASALEGERLAAARAVSQNQQLKQQLTEMQDAFVQLSNAKLDLTEQLQGERAIGRKLNARLNTTEDDVDKLKEEIQRKDSLLAELEKEKLHAAQIADQMQHYQAQSHNASTLQQELHNAQERIETLTKQNQQLIDELNATRTLNQSIDQNQSTVDLESKHISEEDNIVEDKIQISTVETQTELYSNAVETETVITEEDKPAITPEAARKLEERFKDTMERVAELSDEKQRLEHLVLQLQSETETIGEYVTLYQKQRLVLQERAKEKEEAFRQLSEQRNQQQEQLHKLKMLVAELLKHKNTPSDTSAVESDKNEEGKEVANHLEMEKPELVEAMTIKDKTTSQILDLLTEIKECKGTSCGSEPNFHPCPWCSGKLITV